MKVNKIIVISIIYFSLLISPGYAQKWVNPHFDAHRIDYRDLGYPEANEVPADDSPITALLSHSNHKIYGATSGSQSFLFVYDPRINKVLPLGQIAGAGGVHHSLLEGKDGQVYIGTGRNVLEQVVLTKDFPGGRRAIEEQLWQDIKAPYESFPGGHLYRYNPQVSDQEAYLTEDSAQLKNLGIPVANNTIYTLSFNQDTTQLYGITYPDAHLFSYDLATGQTTDLGPFLEGKSYAGPERTWRSVPRSLAAGPEGRMYTSGDDGWIVYYDPGTKQVERTEMRLPGEYWEAWNYYGYPVVEQWVSTNDSTYYGSTSDGFIFCMNLVQETLTNLGKPRWSRRVRGMALGPDHRLYMLCGEREEPVKMYSYDLVGQEGFINYGVLGVDRSPYYAKRPYQFDAMIAGHDGSLYLGESDRRAKLFIYQPENSGAAVFNGTLNPTNPR